MSEKVVIYISQLENPYYTVSNQKEICKKYCILKEYEIVKIYIDGEKRGNKFLELVKNNSEYKFVVVFSVACFSSELSKLSKLMNTIYKLIDKNIYVDSFNESDLHICMKIESSNCKEYFKNLDINTKTVEKYNKTHTNFQLNIMLSVACYSDKTWNKLKNLKLF